MTQLPLFPTTTCSIGFYAPSSLHIIKLDNGVEQSWGLGRTRFGALRSIVRRLK